MSIRPHYFGPHESPLFGCYHAPAPGKTTKDGVLLCQPTGHEYMACYRTMRQTAVRLAQIGRPALRFDFYGSGDSAGDSSDGSVSQWVRDVVMATAELQKQQHTMALTVAGLRLGASVALLALRDRPPVDVRALILWDPIVRGDAYVEELTALQNERFRRPDANEILGFPFTATLREELARLDLLKAERTAGRVLIIETGPAKPEIRQLAVRLTNLGASVEQHAVPGPTIWHEPNKASVPATVIQSLVTWVGNTL